MSMGLKMSRMLINNNIILFVDTGTFRSEIMFSQLYI